MKINIFYFSGTGNTWYMANILAKRLSKLKNLAKAYSIEKISIEFANKKINESDIVVFCYPIYASFVPKPMENFVNSLTSNNKNTAVVCTQMMFSGDGAYVLSKILAKKGFITKWAMHINMSNNLNAGAFSFMPITNDPKKLRRMRKKTYKKVKILSDLICKNESYRQGFNKISKLLGDTQRPGKYFSPNQMWDKVMQINQNECIKCGFCKKICPIDNIIMDENYFIKDNCAACMRCHNLCPVKAVYFKNKKSLKQSYKGPIPNFSIKNCKDF